MSTTVFPAASAGTAQRMSCQNGKFQGITASTTPSGSKHTWLSAASVGTGSGSRRVGAWSANHSQVTAHLATSASAWAMGLPISAVMRAA